MGSERSQNVILNEKIKPVPALLRYNLLSVVLLAVVPVAILVAAVLYGSAEGALIALAINIVILVPSTVWAVLSHRYLWYRFTETEMEWGRGIMFRATGIVPYSKITHIKIVQGPVMRLFGLSALKIQTAGSSGAQGTDPEIRIEGLENYYDYRTFVLDHIPASGEGRAEKAALPASERALEELVKIRELLEAGAGPRQK